MDQYLQPNVLVALCILGAAAIGWFVRLEARLSGKLDIEKHEEICNRARAENKEALGEIKKLMIEANIDRSEMKNSINVELNEIKIKLAVLVVQGNNK